MSRHRHSDPLQHINDDHAGELLLAVRSLAGHPAATAARAERIDNLGIDVVVDTPDGPTAARIDFVDPIPVTDYPAAVRVAFVRLVRRARSANLPGSHDRPAR